MRVAWLALLCACGGIVADFDASAPPAVDGAVRDAAVADVGADACSFGEHRQNADRTCTSNAECQVVIHAVDCCQVRGEGVLVSKAGSFIAAENAQVCTCNVGCAAQPVDELGQRGTEFNATCDKGLCTAHAK